MTDLSVEVTGGLLIASALMLNLGWTLLPVKLGAFLKVEDFSNVHSRLLTWILLFRIHLFGFVVTAMALIALASLLSKSWTRILLWPAVGVCGAGLIVMALAAAFYYHFGAWGAVDMAGKSRDQIQAFVDSLQVTTEYVTCLMRFGRVFFGFGQIVLAIGLWLGGGLPPWIAIAAAVLGFAAIAVTMARPDNLEYYAPVFHLNTVWLLATGWVVLRTGGELAAQLPA